VIEAQRHFGRRTLHTHASGLRTFFKFWMRRGRLKRNPLAGVPLPKLEKRLPKFLTEEQIYIGRPSRAFPVSPPDMRVRIRRFGEAKSD
jgi:site-specific recombinase XerD